ncbi:HAD family hydrolase [Amylibacter sp.]|nr:HAD family hydrolase [Amylibacter sp.]
MIRAVVFDFDGTLVPSNHVKKKILTQHFSELVFDNQRAIELISAGNLNRYQIFDEISSDMKRCKITKDIFFAKLNIALEEAICQLPLRGDAMSCLTELRDKGIGMYLSSATPHVNLVNIVNKKALTGFFSKINGSPTSKINFIHELLDDGILQSEIIIFGDGIDDEESANICSVQFCSALSDNSFDELLRLVIK